MNSRKQILMISMAAIMGVAMIAPSVSAEYWNFLDIGRANIVTDSDEFAKVGLTIKSQIPLDGSGGAFGYGVISDTSLEAILVTTTHAGVLDSAAQADEHDAVFHTHYVALQDSADASGLCEGLEIQNITFEEPGSASVSWNDVSMEKIPYSFSGTDSLTGEEISLLTSGNVTSIVSFAIEPIIDVDDTVLAVCINDVQHTDSFRQHERNSSPISSPDRAE